MVDGNLVEMGKLIGAGLACTGMGGAAIGVGHVVGNFLSGALRNPSAASGQTATMFIGIAFAEALDHSSEIQRYDGLGRPLWAT